MNPIAGKFLSALALLLIVIPGLGWLLAALGLHTPVLTWIVRASLWAGGGLLLVFVLLVIAEQILDARLLRRHRQTLARRILLEDGSAECPNCGYRGLRAFERECPGCGKRLT